MILAPEILVKLGAIQNKTSDAFNELIDDLPDDDQKRYWEIIRHEGLVERIVSGGPKPQEELQAIVNDFPEEVRKNAIELGTSEFSTLVKINEIDKTADRAYDMLLEDCSSEIRTNINLLLEFPEVLHILTTNLDLTILVGEAYKANPEMVIRKADSIKVEASKRHTQEINDWKQGLADDPQALEEFEKVSKEFTNENRYEDNDPMYPNTSIPSDNTEIDPPEQDVNVYYNYYPYPYWYGYPGWFPDTFWYHYPYWYHWGFYYGPRSSIVISGLPSYYFISWYFRFPYHYYRYPYFSDYVIRYYRSGPGPRRNGLATAVREWEYRNRGEVHNRLMSRAGSRDARVWKDYGRFEEAYIKRQRTYVREGTGRTEYLNRSARKYPSLSGTRSKPTRGAYSVPSKKRTLNTRPPGRATEFNRARDRHQRTWERSDYSQRKRTVRPTSPTRRSSGAVRRSSSSSSRNRRKNK
ncbi:MAG: hypothetical protein AAFN93_22975 [Bacteroidota bacterium]